MTKYNVEIIEKLSRIVEVEANTYQEAQDEVENMYNNSNIVLDYEDFKNTEYMHYPSQNLKEDFTITVEFSKKYKNVCIRSDNFSRENYLCETAEQLKSAINTHIDTFINLESRKELPEIQKKEKNEIER